MPVLLLVQAFAFCQSDTILSPSGVRIVVVQAGKGNKAINGQKLMVHYKGSLPNGDVFEDSHEIGDPFIFTLGNKEVIKGWEEGFAQLNKGAKAIFIIPANLGYGAEGVRKQDDFSQYKIPPNTELTYEVEVLSIR